MKSGHSKKINSPETPFILIILSDTTQTAISFSCNQWFTQKSKLFLSRYITVMTMFN